MWVFIQRTGELIAPDGEIVVGYSGCGVGKNNPAADSLPGVGPIPRGRYLMGAPVHSPAHGAYPVIPLTPMVENEMHGRRGFLVHGDSVASPGTASKGCVIAPRATRERMAAQRDVLLVLSDRVQLKDVML